MPRTPPWLQSILEEHFEELQMLWELRESALRDPDYLAEDIPELDERIEAHVDGLVLGGENALPILEEGLGGDEPPVPFAAGYVMLRIGQQELADKLMDAFLEAQEGQLDGLRQALCHGSIGLVVDRLKSAYETGPTEVAAAAAEVFAFHGQLRREPSRLAEFFAHEDPGVRRAAWRITAMIGGDGD